jgi:hypothetical protein
MATVKTNIYEVAGETAMIEMLKEITATLEKRADLDMFQLESMLTIVKNDFAPLIMLSMDPKLPFIYLAMKKILESMVDRLKQAREQHEQKEYAYGFPAAEEMDFDQGAFGFQPY